MFTCQKYKLGGDAAITTASPSTDVESQQLPTESSPEKPEGRKRAVKVGGSIASKDVVVVPFGTLAGDFGIRPLPAKERNCQALANEASEAPLLKVTAGEVPAAPSVTSKEAKGKRNRNVVEDAVKVTEKKTRVKSTEAKEQGDGKDALIADVLHVDEFAFDKADVFDFSYVEEQPEKSPKKPTPMKTTEPPEKSPKKPTPKKTIIQVKKETKKATPKKVTNRGRKAKNIVVVGDDNNLDNDNILVFPFILG